MTDWVYHKLPFFHTRYGDGELNSMFKLASDTSTNCDGCRYYKNMGLALLNAFNEMVSTYSHNRQDLPRLLIGSNNETHPDLNCTKVFVDYMTKEGIDRGALPWCVGDFWWNPAKQPECILTLLNTIRYQNPMRNVVFVGNQKVAGAKYCLGAHHVEIPTTDLWLVRHDILNECDNYGREDHNTIYVWAAGQAGKVLAWDIHKRYPYSSHIDVGHTFDGAFGVPSRNWIDHPSECPEHWGYCRDVFNPYVRSFLPSEPSDAS